MNKQDTLRPLDVPVILGLLEDGPSEPATYQQLGQLLGLSQSTVYQAVKRLQAAGLLRPETRIPNRAALREFLVHGVRYVFAPALGREAVGVPTAHSGPALGGQFDASDAFVWPSADGSARGTSLAPLYPAATKLPQRAPEVYRLLTLVDAIRVGRARERGAAVAAIDHHLRREVGAGHADG